MIYLEVKDGVAWAGPFEYTGDLPVLHPSVTPIDVTGMDPMPAQDWTYDGTSFTAPTTPLVSAEELREMRDVLLGMSDWRDLPSYQGTDQAAWRTYRQELRDMPENYVPTSSPLWPAPPS